MKSKLKKKKMIKKKKNYLIIKINYNFCFEKLFISILFAIIKLNNYS